MSICNLCFVEHENVWEKDPTQPHVYCISCQKIRKEAKGTATHVIGSLYLGDIQAAVKFDGDKLCVHENPLLVVQHHIPILKKQPNSFLDRTGALVDRKQLFACLDFIGEYVRADKPLIVHCKAGVERSPLVMACFLYDEYHFRPLSLAYMYLVRKRPTISDRSFWLPHNLYSMYYSH